MIAIALIMKEKLLQPISKYNQSFLNVPELSEDHSNAVITKLAPISFESCLLTPINSLYVGCQLTNTGLRTAYNKEKLPLWKNMYLYWKFRYLTKIQEHIGVFFWNHDIWSANYYHWLCETLPRLYLLYKENPDGIIILPDEFKGYKYIADSLDLLGLRYQWINFRYSHRFTQLYTIKTDPPLGNVNPEVQKELRNVLKEKGCSTKSIVASKKLFISRSKARYRKLINEDELTPMLKCLGFEVIYTESLSFAEQIELFSQAKCIIAQHGAGLTNLMYMQPGTIVIEIRQHKWEVHPLCYWRLANIFDIKWSVLPANPVNEEANMADISVDISALESLLSELNDDSNYSHLC